MTTIYCLLRDRVSRSPFQFVAAIVAAGLAAVWLVGGEVVRPTAHSPLPPVVGVFTGQLDGGIPVYRLPPISVSADRSVAARDAEAARAREARAPSDS